MDQVDASCPVCDVRSARVHSHYWRSLGDVPCLGRQLVLLVRIRRFRCVNRHYGAVAKSSQFRLMIQIQ